MRYFRIKNRVRQVLIDYPETRDNDNALIAYLLMDMEFLQLNEMNAEEFLQNLKNGEYGSLESIRRSRQLLQEKNPDLRGELWKKRHNFKHEVKNQLRFNFD